MPTARRFLHQPRPSTPATSARVASGALWLTALLVAVFTASALRAAPERPDIVLLLSDDHRYDFLGCVEGGPAFLETPNLDRLAAEGALFESSFVVTSLCSPSRASILSGRRTRHHGVVDNQRPVPPGLVFFPALLQRAGYETAFIGKWHMGHERDDPRPGFEHWESFRGQGTYFDPVLNVDGERRKLSGYTTDVLAERAARWLSRPASRPRFLMLAFKAVHYPFRPAPRHLGRYEKGEIPYPETMALTERNYESQPRWVRERRYGIHGIDHMQTGALDHDPVPDFDDLYRRYAETVHGLDEDIGRVLAAIDASGRAARTVVLYTSDNGFELGEHGFYDKRDAFEESIRVPLIARAPGIARPGSRIGEIVLNIDLAPTILALAGAPAGPEARLDGRSLLPLLRGEEVPWRDRFLYEYFWEWNFPATPTVLALRTERYKYIFYHGVWDRNGFYDLATDPHERVNLIRVPAFAERIDAMRKELFDRLEADGPLAVPFRRPAGEQYYDRKLRR